MTENILNDIIGYSEDELKAFISRLENCINDGNEYQKIFENIEDKDKIDDETAEIVVKKLFKELNRGNED